MCDEEAARSISPLWYSVPLGHGQTRLSCSVTLRTTQGDSLMEALPNLSVFALKGVNCLKGGGLGRAGNLPGEHDHAVRNFVLAQALPAAPYHLLLLLRQQLHPACTSTTTTTITSTAFISGFCFFLLLLLRLDQDQAELFEASPITTLRENPRRERETEREGGRERERERKCRSTHLEKNKKQSPVSHECEGN